LLARERNSAGPGIDGRWAGTALNGRHEFSGGFALNLRGEVFDDTKGDRTGTAQTLTALTLTPEVKVTPHFMVRGDLRLDRSSASAFEKRVGRASQQPTAMLNLVFRF